MSHQIDPLILQKLTAFSERRRRLIIYRGVCVAVATLVATMMIIAFVDWLFVLPDVARWTLSLVAYAVVIVVEWRSCLRQLMRAPGPRRLARLVEHAEPRLREDLISAVELGDAKSNAAFDSEQFRALLQSDVAARMQKMDVERLLPVNLVRRYVGIAIAIGVACIVAFALTGFQFGTLMMRALLPMANLARVSKVQVKIVEPQPAEMRVPQGDTVPLVIEIAGQRANRAVLETFTRSGGRELVQMNPVGKDRFSATIQVSREDVQYRVRAGDAITRKYRLESVERPGVVHFEKTYVYPAYSLLATKRVTEENGDLVAIEGTEVELRLSTNQKVKGAELRIEQGKNSAVVPLKADGDKLFAKVPMNASGVYRVRLVGAESGFENKFSPEYELRAEPDLVPQVELELPKQDLILPSNEIVDVQGTASDDLALAKVSQLVKINEGGWKEVPLAKEPGAKVKVERRWDLYDAGVKPGDLVTMKLVAVDLKGNRGESRPLQVTITAAGFESKRLSALEGQQMLLKTLEAQFTAAAALAKGSAEARAVFDRTPDADAGRKQALVAAIAAFDEFDRKNGETVAQLAGTLREAAAGHQTGDLVLLARALSRTNAGVAQNARRIFDALGADPATPAARELMRDAAEAGARTEQRAKAALDTCRMFLTSEEMDVLNENFHVVAKEQERLAELAKNSGDDEAKWTQLISRMRVVLTETRTLDDLAGAMSEHGISLMRDRMRVLQKDINKQRAALETAMAGKKPGKDLLAPTLAMTNAVTDAARRALSFRRDLQWDPPKRYNDLLADTQPTFTNFDKLRQEIVILSKMDGLPDGMRAGLIDGRWDAKAKVLKAHGDAEELRPDSDSYFVNDVRSTSLVVQGLREKRNELRSDQMAKELSALEKDFRLLESGHEVAELYEGLVHLAVLERWEIYNPKSRTANPHDWKWLEARLRAAPDALARALAGEEIRPVLDKAREHLWKAMNDASTQRVNQEMEQRFDPQREPVTAKKDVEIVAANVKLALDILRKPMDEARKELAQMAPKLSEIMARLAKETEQLQNETAEQAHKAQDKRPDEAKAEAKHALAGQQSLNERVDALKDAIRADANQQDVLKKDGRERARDADDALAMLKDPPVRAEEDLQRAAKTDHAAQEQALTQASEQQQKLADALHMLADHYDNLEKGKPEDSRVALRATEEANGVKEQLDQQFAKAEQLAQMAQQSPQELLTQLEKALPQNPQMQQELSAISQSTLNAAADKLQQASGKENAVAQQVSELAKPDAPQTAREAAQKAAEAAQKAAQAAQAAGKAADEAAQSAKAANNTTAAQQSGDARAQAEQAARNAEQAAQWAQKAVQAGQPQELAQSAQQAAQQAAEAAAHAQQAAQAAQQSAQNSGNKQPAQNQQSAQQAGEAAKGAQEAAQSAQQAQAAAQQAAAMAQQQMQMAQNAAQPGAQGQPAAQNPALAQAAQQQPEIAQSANNAGADIQRAGRHEERLQNMAAGQQLQQLGSQVQQTAQQQVPGAQQALAQAQQAAQAQAAVNAANNELKSELSQLQAAQNPGQQPASQPGGQQPAQTSPQGARPQGAESQAGQQGAAPASPQEQAWMARTLDALDAALNAQGSQPPGAEGQPQQASQGQQGQQQGQQPGQQPGQGQAMNEAQSAMSQAAAAAQASMRGSRSEQASEQPGGPMAQGGQQAVSKGGAQAQAGAQGHGALGDAKNKGGEWGRLPKQMAEQLSQGQREGVAGEYRNQIETYYRVIAEKSKKP